MRLNWKNQYRNEGYGCVDCLALDPPVRHPDYQDVLVTPACQGNSDLRQGRDMKDKRMQAHFLIDMIARRNTRYGGQE